MNSEKIVIYREPAVEDAEAIVAFYNRVGGETNFLSFKENEYPMNVEGQKIAILGMKDQPHCVMILALAENQIVGIGTIMSETKVKSRHIGGLGIVVEKKYQGRGLGRELMNRLIQFCRLNGVTAKIRLDARTDNEIAVELYKRCGFEIEGELKNAALVDGVYYHVYVMGMML